MPRGSHKGGNKSAGMKRRWKKWKRKRDEGIRNEDKLHSKEKFENQVYAYCGRQALYNVQKVFLLDAFHKDPQYECSIHIGNQEYFSFGLAPSEDVALHRAILKCYDSWKCGLRKPTVGGSKLIATKTVDTLSTHEWTESLSNVTIAGLFKDILRHFATANNERREEYTTRVSHEGTLVGYTSQVNFKQEIFTNLGLMTSEDQAEQSAAEICLRTLGYLPDVNSEKDLTIQPFEGGFFSQITDSTLSKPYLFTSKLSSNILDTFVASRSLMECPKYYVIMAGDAGDTADQVIDCICCVDGKVFEASSYRQPKHVAVQLVADKALSYFGMSNLHERMELRKHIRLLRNDFYDIENLTNLRKPNVNKRWLWNCFGRDNSYDECEISKTVKDLLASPIFLGNLPLVDYKNELIEAEIRRKPSFEGSSLASLDNICVAAIDPANPNLVTIGNSEFSMKLWCTGGKIYSKEKECAVDISLGHVIQQLSCEYRVLLPSLEVYLHAVDCNDLIYSDLQEPVVVSCGVIVLVSDDYSGVNNISVLLQRRTDYKKLKGAPVCLLKEFLHNLRYNKTVDVTVAKVMEDVHEWEEDDVRLLSLMTFKSMRELIGKYGRYEDRWNKLLAKSEIPEELKEMKDICLNELKRRRDEEEELSMKNVDSIHQQWGLPQTEFLSRFDETGIHIEGSKLCAMRSLAEMTGMKISLADVEKCSIIDIPVNEDGKQHVVSRYYIWNKMEETLVSETKVVNELPGGYKILKERDIIKHNSTRYILTRDVKRRKMRMLRYLRNVQYINTDGTKVSPWNAPVMALSSNSSNTSNADGAVTVRMPGDGNFESYRKSLKFALKSVNITSHKSFIKRSEDAMGKYKTIDFTLKDKRYFFKSKPCQSFIEAEEEISKKVLKALGFNIPDESDTIEAFPKEENESGDDEHVEDNDEDISKKSCVQNEGHGGMDHTGKQDDEEEEGEYDDSEEIDDHAGESSKEEHLDQEGTVFSRLPPRNALCLHCEWTVLDRAIDACPMLKKIAVTSHFQDLIQQGAK